MGNEAAAVAYKARMKVTGQALGTRNTICPVIQYPVSTRDPHNMAQNVKNHLSAEDRRILRVRVKHACRGVVGDGGVRIRHPSYPENVYLTEKMLLKGFAKSPEMQTMTSPIEFWSRQFTLLKVTARVHV